MKPQPKYKVGDKLKILDRRYSHGFDIGREVEVIEPPKFQESVRDYSYRCEWGRVTWFVLESSMTPVGFSIKKVTEFFDNKLFEID